MAIQQQAISDATQDILSRIQAVIARAHLSVEYRSDGIIFDNAREYDLKTRQGRDRYQHKCLKMIGYLTAFEARNLRETGQAPDHLSIHRDGLEPWLSTYLLIDDLKFQMETQDDFDGFEPP